MAFCKEDKYRGSSICQSDKGYCAYYLLYAHSLKRQIENALLLRESCPLFLWVLSMKAQLVSGSEV